MTPRQLISILALIALLFGAGVSIQPLLNDSSIWPPDDYVEYWAAGRLNLRGQNPYSPELLLPMERAAGRDTDEAIMMWNPPWTLSAAMPLGALPARAGQFVWLFLQAGCLVAAAWMLRPGEPTRVSGRVNPVLVSYPDVRNHTHAHADRLAGLLTFAFVPTLFLLQSGQIAGLIVLGAALFVVCVRHGYPMFAGVAAVLIAIKPHLAYLLWLAVALDAIQHRRYRIVFGGILGGIVFTLIPMAFNPDVWSHYFAAYRDHPPAQWVSLTLGTFLRFALGERHFWLQFVPMLLGIGWFIRHWRAHAQHWNWAEQMPAILLVSFATAPYGAWHFDLVLLLIPIWHLAAILMGRRRWIAFGLFAGANTAMLALNAAGVWSYAYAWVAPLVLVSYFGLRLPSRAAVPRIVPA